MLRSLAPDLRPGVFVFASDHRQPGRDLVAAAVAIVRETEGVTLVLPEAVAAAHRMDAVFRCRQITLTVHSSLAAVGLTAAFAGALTAAGISANTIAGIHHDHLFVPVDDAERAVASCADWRKSAIERQRRRLREQQRSRPCICRRRDHFDAVFALQEWGNAVILHQSLATEREFRAVRSGLACARVDPVPRPRH